MEFVGGHFTLFSSSLERPCLTDFSKPYRIVLCNTIAFNQSSYPISTAGGNRKSNTYNSCSTTFRCLHGSGKSRKDYLSTVFSFRLLACLFFYTYFRLFITLKSSRDLRKMMTGDSPSGQRSNIGPTLEPVRVLSSVST